MRATRDAAPWVERSRVFSEEVDGPPAQHNALRRQRRVKGRARIPNTALRTLGRLAVPRIAPQYVLAVPVGRDQREGDDREEIALRTRPGALVKNSELVVCRRINPAEGLWLASLSSPG